ncbi:MAG TPA: ABC transporter permease [Rhodopila sp.]|uniref:ABC transporter permease n=1 Tax=Rhodopila sp. TaxID=2480087 RepID=UPI002B6FF5A1|nr:ABC transporter permease [Rhodopila sp.]HVY15014.1 ABC transporter permease [Rhodopila sp.]
MSARPGSYRLTSPVWCVPVILFLAMFFIVPLAANLARTDAPQGWFFYYQKLLYDPYYAGVLWETVKVSLITTLACLVVGYPVSYFMVRHAGRWNALIVFCIVAPLLTSIIMRTFGWRVLLARKGLLNTLLMDIGLVTRPENLADDRIAVYIGLVHVLVPFMVLSITAVLQGVDVKLEESARVLGAGRSRTFLHVTLPLSIEGIATGCILVFVITNGSFLTMLLLGGSKITTLSLLIYQQFTTTEDIGFAAAMGNILILVAVLCFIVQYALLRRRNGS